MPPVLHVQRSRHGQPRESGILPPGAPLLSGETTLISVRWGAYRVRVGTPRRLRPGDTGSLQHGADRYDFAVLRSERSFRPALVTSADLPYLGSLSLTASTILLSAAVAWSRPPRPAIDFFAIPDRCGFALTLTPLQRSMPCGAVLPEDLAGLSTAQARLRLDDIIDQSAAYCGTGTPDGPGSLQLGESTAGMIALVDGDPHEFAALNVALRECQRGFAGEVSLTIIAGVAFMHGAESVADCLNREALPLTDAAMDLRMWRL